MLQLLSVRDTENRASVKAGAITLVSFLPHSYSYIYNLLRLGQEVFLFVVYFNYFKNNIFLVSL